MTRIKIAIGAVQIEYEGAQEFVEKGLLELAAQVFELAGSSPAPRAAGLNVESSISTYESNLSTNTIAQTLGVKTGSDLALSAVAKMIIVDKKPLAGRQSILDEMKEAVTFYKESYSSNLSSYIDTLVKARKLNVVSRGTYGLANSERTRLEQALSRAGA